MHRPTLLNRVRALKNPNRIHDIDLKFYNDAISEIMISAQKINTSLLINLQAQNPSIGRNVMSLHIDKKIFAYQRTNYMVI